MLVIGLHRPDTVKEIFVWRNRDAPDEYVEHFVSKGVPADYHLDQ